MFSLIQPPIICDKVVHLYRGESVRQKSDDLEHNQLLKGGRWKADGSLDTSYLDSQVPLAFARVAAGFPDTKGFYFLIRNQIVPTQVHIINNSMRFHRLIE